MLLVHPRGRVSFPACALAPQEEECGQKLGSAPVFLRKGMGQGHTEGCGFKHRGQLGGILGHTQHDDQNQKL